MMRVPWCPLVPLSTQIEREREGWRESKVRMDRAYFAQLARDIAEMNRRPTTKE